MNQTSTPSSYASALFGAGACLVYAYSHYNTRCRVKTNNNATSTITPMSNSVGVASTTITNTTTPATSTSSTPISATITPTPTPTSTSTLSIKFAKTPTLTYEFVDIKPNLPTIAVDLDEVLGHFVVHLANHHNQVYGGDLTLDSFYSYDFSKVWNCTKQEADSKMITFFQSQHFYDIATLSHSYQVLKEYSNHFNFAIVTSRHLILQEATHEWLQMNFPGIFCKILFGNHWAKEGQKITKADMCVMVNACMLIDDNLSYVIECAQLKQFQCILFDHENAYKWNKYDDTLLPNNVVRLTNWLQVREKLKELIVSQN